MYDIPEDSTLHSRNISLMGLEARPDLMSNNVIDTTIENKDDFVESLSEARLVARLVPPHLISGHRVPLSSTQQSSKQKIPEVHLYAGQVITLGRDVANDIQIRDAAGK